jgi:hypothetical protein
MSIRQLILASGLLCSFSAICAEESGPTLVVGGTVEVSSDQSVLCRQCTVQFAPNATMRLEANRMVADSSTGIVRLEGRVRVTFQNGSEVQTESATVTASPKGQVLNSEELRFIKPK